MWRTLVMRIEGLAKQKPPGRRPAVFVPGLVEETDFGPNPGNLRLFRHLPRGLKPGAPLVVVLHGCGQTAPGYDLGAGWAQLAQKFGFAVLAPEQKVVNNPNTCFDWFLPGDVTRGEGEVASIHQMIQHILPRHGLDPARVFVTGLSAGGAMTAAMLATYPETFAGGAIVAGLPYGAAANVRDALETMRRAPLKTPQAWGDAVRKASPHAGPWPKVSIWHGDADMTVNISNAQASAAQWADVQGLSLTDAVEEKSASHMRLSWMKDGKPVLELYTIAGLGHGTPITMAGPEAAGMPAPFILEAGISSSYRIASFWGLTEAAAPMHVVPPVFEMAAEAKVAAAEAVVEAAAARGRIEGTIVRALKAAGLIKSR